MTSPIGVRLKAARIKKGLSQAELAEQIGVSQAAIGQWERGQYLPKGKNINALNEALAPELLLEENRSGGISIAGQGATPASSRPSNVGGSNTSGQLAAENDDSGWTRRGYSGREFIEEVEALLKQQHIVPRRNAVFNGSNNRRWVVDMTTDDSLIEFVNPMAFTKPNYAQVQQKVQSTLWRLVLLRQYIGANFNYIAVVCSPPTDPVALENGDVYIYRSLDYDILELVEDADALGITVILASTPEEAATKISRLRR